MRLKCASAISAFWPSVNGAGGNTSSAEAPPCAAILAMRAASTLPSAQMPLTIGSLRADLVLRDVEHAALFLESAGGDFGGMRIDGKRRKAFDGGDITQMLAEIRLVDRQVVLERQQYRRDHAMRDIVRVPCHHMLLDQTAAFTGALSPI